MIFLRRIVGFIIVVTSAILLGVLLTALWWRLWFYHDIIGVPTYVYPQGMSGEAAYDYIFNMMLLTTLPIAFIIVFLIYRLLRRKKLTTEKPATGQRAKKGSG